MSKTGCHATTGHYSFETIEKKARRSEGSKKSRKEVKKEIKMKGVEDRKEKIKEI